MTNHIFEVENIELYQKICGVNDKNLHKIEKLTGVDIIPRGNTFLIKADQKKSEKVLLLLETILDFVVLKERSYELSDFDITYLSNGILSGEKISVKAIGRLKIKISESGKTIVPKTVNQGKYISAMNEKALTFGIGPAGTGKTFLAVVLAVDALLKGRVERIVLTRPAVEAGENLGFLPGDLIQKINPYLRPLYDSLYNLLSFEKVNQLIETGSIEIAPLAYMRGRTLNNSFIILDEAQNTTITQMKMFLTRLGDNSKIVVTGDITQIDLEKKSKSGLVHATRILKSIKDIAFIRFENKDISRHPIVGKIVSAYEKKSEN
jgi:phosphate starvation-inducible protein PhoH and related proteins